MAGSDARLSRISERVHWRRGGGGRCGFLLIMSGLGDAWPSKDPRDSTTTTDLINITCRPRIKESPLQQNSPVLRLCLFIIMRVFSCSSFCCGGVVAEPDVVAY